MGPVKWRVEELNRKIQEQDVTITRLKKEMEIVVTCLKEQGSKIQKVGTQLEVKTDVPRKRTKTPWMSADRNSGLHRTTMIRGE